MTPPSRHHLHRLLSVLALACAAQPAVGQQDTDALAQLLPKLAAEGFVERELAAREIETDPRISLNDIEAALASPGLDREQRRRLIVASRRRFFSEPRAAMGIMLGEMASVGLRITGTTPGFDADGKLQAGDILAEIDGLAIRQPEDLQVAIISRSPSDTVPVVVVRDGQTMHIPVTLGAWSSLGQQNAPRYEVLEMSWAYRFGAVLSLDPPKVIPSLQSDPSRREDDPNAAISRRSELIIGGEPRPDAGRAAGLRLDRPLSPTERASPISYAERLALKLSEIEADMELTQARLERARERLESARQFDNERRRLDAEELVLQHERTLAAQRSDAERLRAELSRVRDP